MRIRIFQPIVPEYRVALFEGLAVRYGDDIEIWAAERLGSDVSYPLSKMRFDYGHPFLKFGPFVWQRGLSLKGLRRGDVVVVCGDVHQLSSLMIAFKARCSGVKVIWWGHHVSAQAKAKRVGIRLGMARMLSDVFLCYTDAGINFLREHGFRNRQVFATGNTIDLRAVQSAISDWSPDRINSFMQAHGFLGKRVLLFCGVLREKVRVDILLKAYEKLVKKMEDLHLVIVGDGEKRGDWQALCKNMGLAPMVTWVGEVRGQDKLAPWFLCAELFVYPGRIGLSLIHAFAFGLPVVLNDNASNHGPEYVAFKPGENGVSFHENKVDDMAEKMEETLKSDNLKQLGINGQKSVVQNYSMTKMVARYAEAIDAAARN